MTEIGSTAESIELQGSREESQRTAILRAEILRGDEVDVTCALEMTEESVFLITDALPSIGDIVHVRLSFPRLVRPLLVSARVTQVRLSNGSGAPAGFRAELIPADAQSTQHVADVVQQVRVKRCPPPSGTSDTRPLSLLFVEDNRLLRDMFSYAVDRYFGRGRGRVELVAVGDVASAARTIDKRADRFDVALVDHYLPNDTGSSFIAKLRASPKHAKMSVIGMSAGGADVRRAMIDAGADLFLQKPIILKDLFCTLELLMANVAGHAQAPGR